MNRALKKFFTPSISSRYLVRLILTGLLAAILFSQVLIPFHIRGKSMEPTYRDGGFNFCFRQKYLFSPPKQFDVVAIRFSGKQFMLLKRIVALEGDIVEIRKGVLFINSKRIDEPYVRTPSDWDLGPRRVEKKHVYVIGDNRSVPMEIHKFGQADIKRILGGPLW